MAIMCGRYALKVEADELARILGLVVPSDFKPRYNIAPSQLAPVVRLRDGDARECVMLRWGLIPSFARDGVGQINARSESVNEKLSFRGAFRQRRCLIPASGFFEWQSRPGQSKQPYHIHLESGECFCFAGIWERWRDVETYAILTTDATERLAPIHHRMPVILPRNQYDEWLSRQSDPAALQSLLRPTTAAMTAQPISTRINKPEHDDPECLTPIQITEPGPASLFDL